MSTGEIALVYGEPATGKSTLLLQTAVQAAKNGSRTLFIDADHSFYAERLFGLSRNHPEVSEQILVSKPNSLADLTCLLSRLDNYISPEVGLVVVDTMTSLYRKEMDGNRNLFSLNRELNLQLAYLLQTARGFGFPVLITSQVRSSPKSDTLKSGLEPVATRVLEYWAQRILRINLLRDGLREVCLEVPEGLHLEDKKAVVRLGDNGFTDC
jgi:DNA repair protein RadA/Sms